MVARYFKNIKHSITSMIEVLETPVVTA